MPKSTNFLISYPQVLEIEPIYDNDIRSQVVENDIEENRRALRI